MNARSWLDSLGPDGAPGEIEAKRLLEAYGVRTPSRWVAPATGPTGRPQFSGPYAVKASSAALLHKTEAGALRLGVPESEVEQAAAGMRAAFPGAAVFAEPMITGSPIELIAGAFRDACLGPSLMLGAGGVFAELYRDVAFRLVPCTRDDVLRMARELRIARLLDGYRGLRVDEDALAETLLRVARIAEDLGPDFSELDVNPLVYESGSWIALDAKVVLDGSRTETLYSRAGRP